MSRALKQANVQLPEDLLNELRETVGKGEMSRFVSEALRRELQRLRHRICARNAQRGGPEVVAVLFGHYHGWDRNSSKTPGRASTRYSGSDKSVKATGTLWESILTEWFRVRSSGRFRSKRTHRGDFFRAAN